jgi:hypothetical protein
MSSGDPEADPLAYTASYLAPAEDLVPLADETGRTVVFYPVDVWKQDQRAGTARPVFFNL